MADSFVVTVGAGLLASVVAGRGLAYGLDSAPARWRRTTEWAIVGGAGVVALVGAIVSKGPAAQLVFAFVLATLPGIIAYLAWRTVLASALVSLLPLYFAIPELVRGRTVHAPATPLDRLIPAQPDWIFVYGSLYVFVLLPLFVIRDGRLFRQAIKAYLLVLLVAYAGFLAYPAAAPRPASIAAGGFAVWCLRLTYSLDSLYNCFPSLHVAHSFVSALACYRVHKQLGIVAALWASLIGVSTLFTKQHFAVDVVAGALIACVAYVVFLRGYPREAIAERDRRLAPRRALGVVAVFAVFAACFWVLYQAGMAVR